MLLFYTLKYKATSTSSLNVCVRSPGELVTGYRRLDGRVLSALLGKKGEREIEKENWFGSVPGVALVRRPPQLGFAQPRSYSWPSYSNELFVTQISFHLS